MSKKLIGSLLGGLFVVASLSTFMSCSDYDDDISDLRNQISTNATDLQSLVAEKIADVETEIAALNSQAAALETAYKAADAALETAIANATNDAKGYADIQAAAAQSAAIAAAQELVNNASSNLQAGLDAANAVIEQQGQTISSLLAADAALQSGIDAAQARADEAYSLAAQAKALADDNAEALEKITTSLGTINETLTSIQTNLTVLGDEIEAVKKTAEANAAKIEAQEKALEELQAANDKALEALAATDDELRSLITANQQSISALETGVAEAKQAAADALTDATAYTDAEVAAVYKELMDKIEELTGVSAGNVHDIYEAIETINTKLTAIYSEMDGIHADIATVNETITELKDSIESINGDIESINGDIDGINTEISAIKDAYQDADAKLQEELDELKEKITELNDKVDAAIDELNTKITDINTTLGLLLNQLLSNLVTGIIYQDKSKVANVYAKVVGNNPGYVNNDASEGGAVTLNGTTVYFPYKDAPDVNTLSTSDYNIQKYAGWIYATVNPTSVDATQCKFFGLENSLGEENENYTLGTAELCNDHLVTTTRATEEGQTNGFYKFLVTSNTTSSKTAPVTDNAAYAIYTKYTFLDTDNKVYSRYAIDLNPTEATVASKTNLTLTGTGDNCTKKEDPITFDVSTVSTGDIVLGTNDLRVYKKYVECTDVKLDGAKVPGAADIFNTANNRLQTTIPANDIGKNDTISISCPDGYLNHVITLTYYIWNYDGSVYSISKEVVFTKLLWSTETVTVNCTPTSDGTNITAGNYAQVFSGLSFLNEVSKVDETYWKDDAVYVEAVTEDGSSDIEGATIKLYNSSKTTDLGKDITVGASKCTLASLGYTSLGSIAEAYVSVDLNNVTIKPDTEYVITLKFYNANGYEINEVTIIYTMTLEGLKPNPLSPWRIETAFYDYNGNGDVLSIDNNPDVTVAWARKSSNPVDGAKYDLAGSFYPLKSSAYFDSYSSTYYYQYKDLDNYVNNTGKYWNYDSGRVPIVEKQPSQTANWYVMVVMADAVNGAYYEADNSGNYTVRYEGDIVTKDEDGKNTETGYNYAFNGEHVFDMIFGIKYYGLSNLISCYTESGWKDECKVVFLSPVRYGILGTKGYLKGKEYTGIELKNALSVNYNGGTLIIDDDNFTVLDPTYSENTPLTLFAMGNSSYSNELVKSIDIEFADANNSNNALFTGDPVQNTDGSWTFTTSKRVSMTSSTIVKFKVIVTDVWGAKTAFILPVTVVPNK